jgi:CHAT domain-containing protein/Tfp pilus assembly protein PilF
MLFNLNHRWLIALVCLALVAQTFAAPKADAFMLSAAPDAASAELAQGKKFLRRGQTAEALPHLDAALKAAENANDKRLAAAAHDALGELYERQGQYGVALTHYEAAQKIFAELSRQNSSSSLNIAPNIEGYNANLLLAKIGDMYERQGMMDAARNAYAQMYAEKPKTDVIGQGQKGKETIGRVKGLGGLLSGGKPSISSVESTASTTSSLIKSPFDSYHNSIAYATREIGLGRIEFFKDNLNDAKTHFQGALDATRGELPGLGATDQAKRYRTAARTALADTELAQGNYARAETLYREAIKNAQDDKRPELAWSAQRGLGKSLWKQATATSDAARAGALREQAISSYRDAIRTLETLRTGSLRADEARTTFLAATKDVYDEATNYLAEMALLAGGKDSSSPLSGKALDYASESLNVAEQGRARSLLDMLAATNAQITEGVPPQLLQRKQENLARQQEIADQLSGVNATGEQPQKSVAELEKELSDLQTEYDSIENQIRTASPRYASLTASAPLTLADIQSRVLDAQTALVEYSINKNGSYLWIVTPTGVNIFKLPARDKIGAQVAAVRDAIIPEKLRRQIVAASEAEAQRGLGLASAESLNPKVAAFASASGELYKMILAPAAALTKDKRLLIVADGALSYVPFECLVTQTGGADYASLAYLVKTNEIVYAPSASVVAALRAQSQTNGNQSNASRAMLIVADPVFDANDPRAKNAKTSGGAINDQVSRGLGLGSAVADVTNANAGSSDVMMTAQPKWTLVRLQGTRAEAQQIGELARASGFKADTWLDLDANEANIKTRDIANYRVLHIATHGLLDTERPQFSGVVLSLVGNRDNDGFLRADEIFNLRLGHPLVMLSACETGLGKEKRGEGVIGLTRAFLYAGAPTVGVTLWSVADKSTADLMTDFYKRLLAKQGAETPAAALRAAQVAMIAGKKYSAPFYWSPFVLVGDWK